MGKFNKKNPGTTKTVNLAGGQAYSQSPELELVSMLLTSFVTDQYYRSANDSIARLEQLASDVDPLFAAKAAVYARNEFGMRSISHVLASTLAKHASGKPWARSFYDKIVRRPDDMLEIISYYFGKGNKRLSSAMQFGFREAIKKFDEYQLAKYRGESKDVKLIDVVRLIRPAADSPNIDAIAKLVKGELKSTETWEAMLTVAGQTATSDDEKLDLKKDAWVELIGNRKIGYFALLRNLRNIMEQAPEVVDDACKMLTDSKLIKGSLVLPFRFLTASSQIDTSSAIGRKVQAAIRKAFEVSVDNIPDLPNTLVVVDNSGSMSGGATHFGSLSHAQLGALFGMLLAKRSNADIMEFGQTARYISYTSNTDVFDFATKFPSNNKVGHATNFQAIFDLANKKYDRIVIFSDMQGWVGYTAPTSSLSKYSSRTGANPHIYSIDLTGYGTTQFPESRIYALAGFSEKIFDLMGKVEEDPNVLLNKISAVEI